MAEMRKRNVGGGMEAPQRVAAPSAAQQLRPNGPDGGTNFFWGDWSQKMVTPMAWVKSVIVESILVALLGFLIVRAHIVGALAGLDPSLHAALVALVAAGILFVVLRWGRHPDNELRHAGLSNILWADNWVQRFGLFPWLVFALLSAPLGWVLAGLATISFGSGPLTLAAYVPQYPAGQSDAITWLTHIICAMLPPLAQPTRGRGLGISQL